MAGQRAVRAKGGSDAVVRAFDYISTHVLLCEQQEIIDKCYCDGTTTSSSFGGWFLHDGWDGAPAEERLHGTNQLRSRCYLPIADLHFT